MEFAKQWLYVLRCEGGTFYVGTTGDITLRFGQHWAGKGGAWTQSHPPIEATLVQADKSTLDEDAMVKRLMNEHGVSSVRGGSYPQVKLNQSQLEALERELNHARGLCFICGLDDHWASACRLSERAAGTRRKDPEAPTPQDKKKASIGQRPKTTAKPPTSTDLGVGPAPESPAQTSAPEAVAPKPAPRGLYCTRCGRNTHLAGACYAKSHLSGKPLPAKEAQEEGVTDGRPAAAPKSPQKSKTEPDLNQ